MTRSGSAPSRGGDGGAGRRPSVAAGAQAERTGLAWQRTGLSLAGVAALVLHAAQGAPSLVLLATAVGLAAAAAALVVSGVRRQRVLQEARGLPDGAPGAPPLRLVVAVAAATVVLAVASAAVVLGA